MEKDSGNPVNFGVDYVIVYKIGDTGNVIFPPLTAQVVL